MLIPGTSLSVRSMLAPAGLIALCGVIALLPDSWQAHLVYQRDDLPQQAWRFISGNLLHTNLMHWLLNSAGVGLIWLLFANHFDAPRFWLTFLVSCLCCTVGLYAFDTHMQWYVGLSGALHGMFIAGAILDIRRRISLGWLLLLGVMAKIAWEQWHGADPAIASLINADVATNAHLCGAFGGLISLTFGNKKSPA